MLCKFNYCLLKQHPTSFQIELLITPKRILNRKTYTLEVRLIIPYRSVRIILHCSAKAVSTGLVVVCEEQVKF